ncbi:MAG: cation diffusion facilitator family transporter [Candidatus Rokuibacteriota bacterium]
MSGGDSKARAEKFAIAGAAGLAVLKLATGLAINSIGLISAAADSIIDVLVSSLNLLSIRVADSPADEGHPYGHGKIENLAGLVQGTVFALIGGWVVWEAVRRFMRGTGPEHAEWGVAVTVVSIAGSWLIARRLRRVAAQTDSVVLMADSLHYATDVWTNGGVLVALVLFRVTGAAVFDPLIASVVGAVILLAASRILARSVHDLMDAAIPEAEQREIEGVIHRHTFVVSSHDLRTRRSGSQRQIDFSVVLCRHLPLGEAHDIVDHIEKEIERTIPNSHVVVHAEPSMPECRLADRCVLSSRQEDLLAHREKADA